MSFVPYGLITTPVLHGAYLEASDPKKRESSTVPLWENLLNNQLANDSVAVNSQLPPDDTTKAVDIVVRYYDNTYHPIIAVLFECKRHGSRSKTKTKNKSISELEDMESQLEGYFQYFFIEDEGLAKRKLVYGAVAFGTRIRAWRATYDGRYVTTTPMWGGSGMADLQSYRDPGKAEGTNDIYNFLNEVKSSIGHDMYPESSSAYPASTSGYSASSSAYPTSTSGYPGVGPASTYQVPYQSSTSQVPNAAGSRPAVHKATDCVYVTISRNTDGKYVTCAPETGAPLKLERDKWTNSQIEYQGQPVDCFMYIGKSGKIYYSWNLVD